MRFLTVFAIVVSCQCLAREDRNSIQFKGEFNQADASSSQCLDFFKQKQYIAKLYFTGPSNQNVVLFLESVGEIGGLHRMNQVGLYGYKNDFRVSRFYKKEGQTIHLEADGIVSSSFLLFKQKVKVLSVENTEVCTGEAEFSSSY